MYRIDSLFLGRDIVDIELIENTDHCLIDCYGILRIHPYLDLTNANTDKWQWTFKDTKENYLPFKSFTTKLKVPVIVPYETTECIKWQEIESINATNSSNKECIDYKITKHTRVKYEYQKFNWNDYTFPIGEDSYVKIEGSIGRGSAVDWIPIIEGFSLNNWAWWNSSFNKARKINVTGSFDSTGVTVKYSVNISDWTSMSNDCSDVRFTPDDNSTELNHFTYVCNKSETTKNATFYINMTTHNDSQNSIYMWYNASGVPDTSNYTGVFNIYDDFNRANSETVGDTLTGQTWTQTNTISNITDNHLLMKDVNNPKVSFAHTLPEDYTTLEVLQENDGADDLDVETFCPLLRWSEAELMRWRYMLLLELVIGIIEAREVITLL